MWRHEDRFAAYVHGLMVRRSRAGRGLGAARLGFREVGRRDFTGAWLSATLLERSLAPALSPDRLPG